MKIGAGWNKTDSNNKEYISWSIDDALKPLVIDNTKSLASFLNERKEKDEHPDWILCMDVKKPKDETQKEEHNTDFIF